MEDKELLPTLPIGHAEPVRTSSLECTVRAACLHTAKLGHVCVSADGQVPQQVAVDSIFVVTLMWTPSKYNIATSKVLGAVTSSYDLIDNANCDTQCCHTRVYCIYYILKQPATRGVVTKPMHMHTQLQAQGGPSGTSRPSIVCNAEMLQQQTCIIQLPHHDMFKQAAGSVNATCLSTWLHLCVHITSPTMNPRGV